ncbi:Z1 domain-containing protein [Pseudomonas syringae]|uniref:Z1 domain-containing protein n=1 Tax=Pseudomonas syringae TaxID=317 RepID=UPI0001E285C3
MITPQVQSWIDQIRRAIPESESIDSAVAIIRASMEQLLGKLSSEQIDDIVTATKFIKKEYSQIEVLRTGSVFNQRPEWYTGPRMKDRHWPALAGYVKEKKGWGTETVDSMNLSSTEVVSLLEDPNKSDFSCRGLVLGYVQSGKTANMSAVIAKAIDAGYNTVLILAGLTDKLRQQTQRRIESDIVNRLPERWTLLTNNYGDFRGLANGGFPRLAKDGIQLAVVKKNVAPLKRLLETINATHPFNLSDLKFLIIDDECDQASVNAASRELDITAINLLIREMLSKLSKVSYIGYTATPFANVLINPYPVDNTNLDDLYPRDFITSLPRPDEYFGAERLFGRPPIDANNETADEAGLNMIRQVSAEDSALLQPSSIKIKDHFYPQISESLIDSLLYFLMCCAARHVRGDANEHMSMLVHTSPFVIMHERVASIIEAWIEQNRQEITSGTDEIALRMKAIWELETAAVAHVNLTQSKPVSFEELFLLLPIVIDSVKVPIENGSSSDRIDYTGEPKTYIIVGGSILARGLTLEGLMVSYFLRSSTRQYDTLLQMGRWFGYRSGYEDLPRIWMPLELIESFRDLAAIEAEIREDINQYKGGRTTPTEFAVRIRTLPGMAITAANKMRAAQICDLSYSGKHIQSIRFSRSNKKEIEANWEAAAELVSQAARLGSPTDPEGNRKLYTNVPQALIVKFLKNYILHDARQDLGTRAILEYVEKTTPKFSSWNIGVYEPTNGKLSSLDLGNLGKVKMVNRSMLEGSEETANIKALMSRRDVLFDCLDDSTSEVNDDWSSLKNYRANKVGNIPLLLIYPIDKDSEPNILRDTKRLPLNALGDLIGIGIVFPGNERAAGGYVSVSLDVPSADELDAIEQEELEQATAAGI